MNAYLVFALVTALRLVSPGTAQFTIDYIDNGTLQSQFDVRTSGSFSRIVLKGEQGGEYLRVERAAAFGQIYTAVPGPALVAHAAVTSQGASNTRSGAAQPITGTRQLPPIAFSLAGLISSIDTLTDGTTESVTIDDPVQALIDAVQPAGAMQGATTGTASGAQSAAVVSAAPGSQTVTAGPPTAGAGGSTTAAASPVSGGTAQAGSTQTQSARAFTVTLARRGEVAYVGIPSQGILLAVHVLP